LNLACYTHASSPLRRYVDLLNQRWIRALMFGFPAPATTLDAFQCNLRSKHIRRLERDMYFLTRVLSRGGGECSRLPSAHGFLLDKKSREGGMEKWRVYVPDWKRVVSCTRLVSMVDVEDDIKKGSRILVRMYLDTRQGDWSRRFIYQAS
jgi:hypothetical protein